jgi:DNA-binding transcriptional regulator YiaG
VNTKELLDLSLARRLCANGEAAKIRRTAGLSLSDIASAVDGSVSGVFRWERGERTPRGERGAAYGRLLRELQKAAA